MKNRVTPPRVDALSDELRIFLVAALPPPLGGMSTWTRAFLDEAPNQNLSIQLRRVGTRSDAQIARASSRIARVGRNVLLPAAEVVAKAARGCDVVHVCSSGTMGIWSGLFIIQAAVLRGIPAVLHVHSGLAGISGASRRWLERLAKNPLVRLVTPSHEDAAEHGEFVLLDNLVAKEFESGRRWEKPTPGSTLKLLYLGWIVRTKGLFELVEAVSKVEDVTLDMVGPEVKPADAADLRALIEAKGLSSRVRIRQAVPHEELADFMARYDALVHPSHAESFGTVAAEAMLVGLPVIGTRVGVLWDLPDDQLVTLPMRDATGIASELERVRDAKHEVLPALSERAFAAATTAFRAAPVVAKWRQLYEELVISR